MQFIYLVSFAVVASNVAALPQPAGLSAKYSSDIDDALAFDLDDRSHQPGLTSQTGLDTLMSLKQQGNSEESSGDNSKSGTPLPSDSISKSIIQEFDSASNKAEFDPLVLSPTIGKAEGDRVGFSRNVKAGVKADEETAGKSAGELVMNYFRKNLVVSVETGIGSLLTRSLVSRVRLLERSVTKRTPINAICSGTDNDVFTLNVQGQLVRSQRWFWSRRTKQLYRNRYWLTPQVRPKTVKQRHSFALMETLRTCGDSASLQKYVTRQLLDTSGFFKDPSFDQSRAHGTRYLMLARMDALWTARKAIQIGILVDTHPFSVDHCILCDQQLLSTSIAHLVVECEQVTGHRIQSGLVPAIQKSRLRLLGRALDPGVENVYTWLRGGVLNGEADLDQLVGWTGLWSMNLWGRGMIIRQLAARLADFLQVAYRQYQSTL
ncbi:hypothetical protein BASA62_006397 [Batrachochytrium salamandrivorans]|nr:hypothetical protein BASA62_006397 [Batrachochytrium salamandrivorans]